MIWGIKGLLGGVIGMLRSVVVGIVVCVLSINAWAWEDAESQRPALAVVNTAGKSAEQIKYEARQAEEKHYLDSVNKLRSLPQEKLEGKQLEEVESLVSDLSDEKYRVREAATLALFKLSRDKSEVLKEIRQRGREKKVSLEAQKRIREIFRHSATIVTREQMGLLVAHQVATSNELQALRDEENQLRQTMSSEDKDVEIVMINALTRPETNVLDMGGGINDDMKCIGMGTRGFVAQRTQARLPRLIDLAGFYSRRLAQGEITEIKSWQTDTSSAHLSYVRGTDAVQWRFRGDGSYQIFKRPVEGGISMMEIMPTDVAPPSAITEYRKDMADVAPLYLELALEKDPKSGQETILATRPKTGTGEYAPIRIEAMRHFDDEAF